MTFPDEPGSAVQWDTAGQHVISFARILVAGGVLLSAEDVIDYFEVPAKRTPEYRMWEDAGCPQPPSNDDLAEARMLGGCQSRDLERRHRHDEQHWNVFASLMEAYQNGSTPLVGLPGRDGAERNTL
ncbi:hypothetical protein JF729_23810 [Mycobacterium intracellulare]|uniref:hypothetical protein n=1 Tax=Mycobacterium intracellulare TaxID=1767 RepID=UPI001CD928B2|nr:hypothetical protein [Mycobacterium intracellulare]MCA2250810.1 hypothetical protein [Mycobacterium intracellulare]